MEAPPPLRLTLINYAEGVYSFDSDMVDAFEALRNDSDRSAAITSVTILEEFLTRNLRKFLIGSGTNREDKLLKGYAPLATLSAKVNINYYLGINRLGNSRRSQGYERYKK